MVAQEDSDPRGPCAFRSGQIVWWEHRHFGYQQVHLTSAEEGRACPVCLERRASQTNRMGSSLSALTRERPLLNWRVFLVALEVANAGDMGTWRLPTSRSEKIERLPEQWRTENWSEYWERNSSGRTLSSWSRGASCSSWDCHTR
ncbi:hypothetical protein CDEST_06875 [Colletotrichum destructivum]|uniref:Zinc-ribbon domain-containing protein n=1 Tax=Colletotrichum destructivum TaxID=34406 RepID=A0AAX4IEQ7_9PEZI|nr:hypothetical protein CDEST_06875 [Colletotrichum destructivum]